MEKIIDQIITVLQHTIKQLQKIQQKKPTFTVTTVLPKLVRTEEDVKIEDRSLTLATGMFQCILTHNRKMKQPNIQKWAEEFERLMRIDKREYADIVDMIKWAQKHDFWHTNILSPKKLREKWDVLFLQREKDKKDGICKNYDFGFNK